MIAGRRNGSPALAGDVGATACFHACMSQPRLRPTQGGSAPAAAVEQIAALRLIGVALVAGEVVFAAIVATMGAQGMLPLASPAIPFADLGGFVVAAVLAAVAFLLRGGIWQ